MDLCVQNLWDFNMANRTLLGKKGSNYGLWVSKPNIDVTSDTNTGNFLFQTSTASTNKFFGTVFAFAPVSGTDAASTAVVSSDITSDSTSAATSNFGGKKTILSVGDDFIPLGEVSGTSGSATISKANTFTNRGLTYNKTGLDFNFVVMLF